MRILFGARAVIALVVIVAFLSASPPSMATPLSTVDGCTNFYYGMSCETFPWQSGLDRIDQRALPVDHRYTYNLTGAGVHIYVVDDGIDVTDPDFGGRATRDFDAVVSQPVVDHRSCAHATLVAKLIGGTQWGAAKSARLHSVRVRYYCNVPGSEDALLKGLRWIKQNAHKPAVVNLSLGTVGDSPAVNSEVAALIASGLAVVIAAGDDSLDACRVSPAKVAAALTVAASSTLDRPIPGSNFGGCIDLFAPGQFPAATEDTGSSYAAGNASGVAALYLQRFGPMSQADLNNRMITNATAGVLMGLMPGTPNRLLYTIFRPIDVIAP